MYEYVRTQCVPFTRLLAHESFFSGSSFTGGGGTGGDHTSITWHATWPPTRRRASRPSCGREGDAQQCGPDRSGGSAGTRSCRCSCPASMHYGNARARESRGGQQAGFSSDIASARLSTHTLQARGQESTRFRRVSANLAGRWLRISPFQFQQSHLTRRRNELSACCIGWR